MDGALAPVAASDKGELRAMFDAYRTALADLVDPDRREGDPLVYPYFDAYWTAADRHPLWVMADGERAGFALVNRVSPSGRGCDHAVAEFCIEPRWRRGGLGLAAARALFERRSGVWELKVHRANAPGLAFWPKAIAAVDPADHQAIDGAEALFHRFRVHGRAAGP